MVFISYNSKDYADACEIKTFLQRIGIECWMAPESIPAGRDYTNAVPEAIKACEQFVLILSEYSQSKEAKWIPKELISAINHDKHVIPFHIDNSEITESFKFQLANVQIIEAFPDLPKSYTRLLTEIMKELNPDENLIRLKKMFPDGFKSLIVDMFSGLFKYVEAFKSFKSDNHQTVEMLNANAAVMQNAAGKLRSFYENNRSSDKENAEKAKRVVEQYNLFAEACGRCYSISSEEIEMHSDAAMQYAAGFSDSIDILKNTLLEMLEQ